MKFSWVDANFLLFYVVHDCPFLYNFLYSFSWHMIFHVCEAFYFIFLNINHRMNNSDSPSGHQNGWCKFEFLMHLWFHSPSNTLLQISPLIIKFYLNVLTFYHVCLMITQIHMTILWFFCRSFFICFLMTFFLIVLFNVMSSIWWSTRIPLQDIILDDASPSFWCISSFFLNWFIIMLSILVHVLLSVYFFRYQAKGCYLIFLTLLEPWHYAKGYYLLYKKPDQQAFVNKRCGFFVPFLLICSSIDVWACLLLDALFFWLWLPYSKCTNCLNIRACVQSLLSFAGKDRGTECFLFLEERWSFCDINQGTVLIISLSGKWSHFGWCIW